MDLNLTTPIAATVSLMQPWYVSTINASAGIIGAIIGGILSIAGVKITQNHNEKIQDEEARRFKREELKKIYIELILVIEKTGTGKVDGDYLIRCLTETLLLGDEDISSLVGRIWNEYSGKLTDPQARTKMVFRMYQEVTPLMRKRLGELERGYKKE